MNNKEKQNEEKQREFSKSGKRGENVEKMLKRKKDEKGKEDERE